MEFITELIESILYIFLFIGGSALVLYIMYVLLLGGGFILGALLLAAARLGVVFPLIGWLFGNLFIELLCTEDVIGINCSPGIISTIPKVFMVIGFCFMLLTLIANGKLSTEQKSYSKNWFE